MANGNNKVLYTGVTSNLPKRVYEHKEHLVDGFTKKYNVDKLVYYETSPSAEGAILREKQLKAGSRAKKIALIEKQNPDWRDLYSDIL
jgi:putative endonuclease